MNACACQAFTHRPLLNEPPSPERLPAKPAAPAHAAPLRGLAGPSQDPACEGDGESPNTGALKRRIAVNALLGLAVSAPARAIEDLNPGFDLSTGSPPRGAAADATLPPTSLTLPAAALRRDKPWASPEADPGRVREPGWAAGRARSWRPPRPPAGPG